MQAFEGQKPGVSSWSNIERLLPPQQGELTYMCVSFNGLFADRRAPTDA